MGVVLYEMLTGTLPFAASDPMELVHAHIARQPVPPRGRSRDIPGPVELIDDGRLPDAGVTRNENQLRPAARHDAVEGGEQGLDFRLAPVQFLGNQQPV